METFAFMGQGNFCEYMKGRLVEAGFTSVGVGEADIVLTYFLSTEALENNYFDEGGVMQLAAPGSLILDFSPSTLSLSRDIFGIAVASEIRYVECPVVVEDMFRKDALSRDNLMSYVGGEKDDVKAALPIISLVVGKTETTGLTGTAQVARCVRTLQDSAIIMAAVESNGMYYAANSSSLAMEVDFGEPTSRVSEIARVLRDIHTEDFSSTYTAEMLYAEIGAAEDLAAEINMFTPSGDAAERLMEMLMVLGGSDMGIAALSLLFYEEEDSAKYGLNWARVKDLMEEQAHGHEFGCDCGCEDEDDEFGEFNDLDDYEEEYDDDEDDEDEDDECAEGECKHGEHGATK